MRARHASTLASAALLALAACSVPDQTFTPDAVPIDAAPDAALAMAMLSAQPSGDAVALGDVIVGQTSMPQSLRISNDGDVATGALEVVLDDPRAGFEVAPDTSHGHPLTGHQTCDLAIRFAPPRAGAAATMLRVRATPGGEVVRALAGTGLVQGAVDLTETSWDFASLAIDAAAVKKTFTVRNTGETVIGMPVAATTGDASYAIDATTCTRPLGKTDTCTVTVAFHPASVGQKAGSLTVTSSASATATAGGTAVLVLAGTGIAHVAVTKLGSGGGLVASTQPGLTCGAACAFDFAASPVTLTAQPELGSTLTGWGGDCASAGTGSCTLSLTGAKAVTATFDITRLPLTLVQAGTGTGTLAVATNPANVAGQSCGASCTAYPYNTQVTITPSAATGTSFTSWSGDCSGTGSCMVTMDRAHAATATFTLDRLDLSVATSGNGTVTSTDTAINCGTQCAASYDFNTTITLVAAASTGSSFTGWTGCTSTSGTTCTVKLTATTAVTATFALGSYPLSVATTGSGAVTSSDGNLNCGTTCTHAYPYATPLTITATPSTGSHFVRWSGGPCDTSTSPRCALTIPAAPTSTTAVFAVDTEMLAVVVAGTGTGTVTSNPNGISCGATCTASYDYNTAVTLTAAPTNGSSASFTGCTSTTGNSCSVTMTASKSITVTFSSGPQVLTAATAGNGAGSVTSDVGGLACPGTCSASIAYNTVVTLTATATGVSSFVGWSGACANATGPCRVTMNQAQSVTATFSAGNQPLTATKSGTGSGTLSFQPACTGAPCSYPYRTVVTITESPSATSTFVGWTGDCTGAGTSCTVTMDQARTVDARFDLVTRQLAIAVAGSGAGRSRPITSARRARTCRAAGPTRSTTPSC